MANSSFSTNHFFTPFEESMDSYAIPARFTFPFDYEPHPLCILATQKLQSYLETQQDLNHNFGLSKVDGAIIGKMFGVLVVETQDGEIGYLSAFSGKLAGENHHTGFVPPIFDGTEDGGFVNIGMLELSRISREIKELEINSQEDVNEVIEVLKSYRKAFSISLQNEIFDQYHFLNKNGEEMSLRKIFEKAAYKNPPAGAGECAAPKLLQYAFGNNMKPLAMAEFWWGLSPKSTQWKHRSFYPACREKCEPILAHMLEGMDLDEKLQ